MKLCPFLRDRCTGDDCELWVGDRCALKFQSKARQADIMPYGRYKGRTFTEIKALGEEGINYLQWLKYDQLPVQIGNTGIEQWKRDSAKRILDEINKALSKVASPTPTRQEIPEEETPPGIPPEEEESPPF